MACIAFRNCMRHGKADHRIQDVVEGDTTGQFKVLYVAKAIAIGALERTQALENIRCTWL